MIGSRTENLFLDFTFCCHAPFLLRYKFIYEYFVGKQEEYMMENCLLPLQLPTSVDATMSQCFACVLKEIGGLIF